MILVDSNVLIDVTADDPLWREWSVVRLADAAAQGEVAIDQIVVAEVGPSFDSLDRFRQRLDMLGIVIVPMTEDAAFLAGQAFRRYKAGGGAAKMILADFLIGAHAVTLDATLLTRDRRFYVKYFPDLPLITPETDNG
ncbi:MAG: type II toxin-antitoxin system VapC family toxin [Sphingomonas sp.]|uniref:type II toxin-antitoxin system VapC family toxin n=1 Tax=Sphingomonas sp. TaxID=28214 RepID=UPI003562859D